MLLPVQPNQDKMQAWMLPQSNLAGKSIKVPQLDRIIACNLVGYTSKMHNLHSNSEAMEALYFSGAQYFLRLPPGVVELHTTTFYKYCENSMIKI